MFELDGPKRAAGLPAQNIDPADAPFPPSILAPGCPVVLNVVPAQAPLLEQTTGAAAADCAVSEVTIVIAIARNPIISNTVRI